MWWYSWVVVAWIILRKIQGIPWEYHVVCNKPVFCNRKQTVQAKKVYYMTCALLYVNLSSSLSLKKICWIRSTCSPAGLFRLEWLINILEALELPCVWDLFILTNGSTLITISHRLIAKSFFVKEIADLIWLHKECISYAMKITLLFFATRAKQDFESILFTLQTYLPVACLILWLPAENVLRNCDFNEQQIILRIML